MTDYTLGDTIYLAFTTRAFATGVPTTLAGTPVVSVLEQNNATPITAGITLSVDRAAVAGLNEVAIAATTGNGYAAGTYSVYISTGTVDGVSVVGEIVGTFTLNSSAAFTRLGAPAGASVSADIADVPTVAELNARTLLAADYFDPATDAVATVTNLTNLPAITSNWLTAAGIAAGALDGKGDWNVGKTGYTLTQTFPANFADQAITATTGLVSVGTNNDKTGYSISGTKQTLDALNDLTAAQVNAEVDTALNTAIPASPTADSINERIAAIDDLTQASGSGDLAAILTDTGTTLPATLGTPVTDLATDIAGVQTDTTNIEVDTQDIQSRLPVALIGGRMNSDIEAINNNTTSADNLQASTLGIVATTVNDTAATTTSFIINSSVTATDHYKGRIIVFTSGVLANQATDITAYNGTTKAVTVTALTSAPANGVSFVIV